MPSVSFGTRYVSLTKALLLSCVAAVSAWAIDFNRVHDEAIKIKATTITKTLHLDLGIPGAGQAVSITRCQTATSVKRC